MRVLIVDDAEAPLRCLERLLGEMGHEVAGTARNGIEAIESYERIHPDLVIMDVIMPRMNGLDALRAIREADPQARVVMSSSLQSCQTAMEAEDRGALYCLAKPFSVKCLRKAIEHIAGAAQPVRAKRRRIHTPLTGAPSPA